MGYIKEPEGVDFVVIPRTKPDLESDRLFSEFIAKQKLKNKNAKTKMAAQAKEIIRRYEASSEGPFSAEVKKKAVNSTLPN